MASNSFGDIFRFTSFGESHGPAVGVVLDGVPASIALAEADFLTELARRRPGQSSLTTQRIEADTPRILSGVFEGKTLGSPIAIIVENTGQRSQDYESLRHTPRPGHADETYAAKYGHRDHRGGGRSSGRETIARVLAGVVARKILPPTLRIVAHAAEIGTIRAAAFDPETIENNPLRCADPLAAIEMVQLVARLREAHDSVGGVVSCHILGCPPGLGEPTFAKIKDRIASGIMSIGAVTGVAYGAGFDAAGMRGSEYVAIRANFGGMLGGISTGEEIVVRASIKPASSVGAIAREGRHDPCIVPRVVPVIEAMVACVLADLLLLRRAGGGLPEMTDGG